MPRVSILLTCYNHIDYLPDCFQSVQDQTFADYEIIAIDDGSADGSREWLTKNAKGATLIFNEWNRGTYASLNIALQKATGEFVAILNDDDLWAPDKLEKQLALFDQHPELGIVHTDGAFIDRNGALVKGSPLGFQFPRTETGDVSLALVYQNKIIASAALVRRACLQVLGGFNERYYGSGDWEMWIRIAEKWHVGFVDQKLCFYRVHGGNASHHLDRIWRDDEMLRSWLAPRLEEYGRRVDKGELKRAQAHNYAALGTVLKLNGKPKKSRQAYLRSLLQNPLRFKSLIRYFATFLSTDSFRKLN